MSNKPDTTVLHALRLIRSEGIGPTNFARLTEKFGGYEAALQAMPRMKKPVQPADFKSIEKEYNRLIKSGGQWLVKHQDIYPEWLRPLDDAPPVLGMLGQVALLQRPMIAIVGSRNASLSGRKLAARLARDLGQAGYVIVSGLARGIDTAAHEAALETGTVAVLANGLDVVYPPENQNLYDHIRQKGVLLSENPLGCQPSSSLFPRRNRIISGLCQAVIVVEAEQKSGSLITIRYALDQGRDVFAVPGSPLDPRAAGPNYLIKTGQAQLIESAKDVLEALDGLRNLDMSGASLRYALDQVEALNQDKGQDKDQDKDQAAPTGRKAEPDETGLLLDMFEPETLPSPTASPESLTDDQARSIVLNHLSPTPCDIDHLNFATQLPTPRLLAILIELELTGQIQRLGGNQVARL